MLRGPRGSVSESRREKSTEPVCWARRLQNPSPPERQVGPCLCAFSMRTAHIASTTPIREREMDSGEAIQYH